MAFSSHRKVFKGCLSGVEIKDLLECDYTRDKLEDRKKFIIEKYKKTEKFYNSYICGDGEREYYKVSLNKTDDLSEEINIFKYIERDATYLLNSRDLPRDKKQEYTFLNEEDFKKISKIEKSLTSLSTDSSENDSNIIEMLEPKRSNDYVNLEHKIVKKDFLDSRSAKVLSDYEEYRIMLKNEMEKIKNKEESKMSLYKIRSLMRDINDDMINAKISLQGIRNPAKRLGDESGAFYTELIDYTNRNHIKAILKNIRLESDLEPDSEISHIAYDMRVAINKLHKEGTLNKLELEIIECYNSGYSNIATGQELGLHERMIRYYLGKICDKIVKYFKK